MPWTSRAEQLKLMQTEYVAVPEDNMIFHERDEEGNPLPPEGQDSIEGGGGNDTTGGGLAREDEFREETEDERFQREQEEENNRNPPERF